METILIIGSGSAGRRHALALRQIFPKAKIDLIKRSGSNQPLVDLQANEINVFFGFENTLDTEYELAVIASPATLHANDVKIVRERANSIVLEKPIAGDLDSALVIQSELTHTTKKSRVAYHLRFSETVIKLKNLIDSREYGQIGHASFTYAQDLVLWRPKIDERQSVSARQELGGGVLLELSHEIEAVQYLMGEIRSVFDFSFSRSGANTDGKVDTVVDFSGVTTNGSNFSIHLDMVTKPPIRSWSFEFDEARIYVNLLSGEISIAKKEKGLQKIHESQPDERDRAGLLMFRSFFKESAAIDLCSIDEAVSVMRVIDSLHESQNFDQ